MEKVVIFILFIVGSIVYENVIKKKKREKVSTTRRDVLDDGDIGKQIFDIFEMGSDSDKTKPFYPQGKKESHSPKSVDKHVKKEHSFFDSIEKEIEIQEEENFHDVELQRQKDLLDVVQQVKKVKREHVPIHSMRQKKRRVKNSLEVIEGFSNLKKAIIYKEIFDKPVSMR